VRYAAGPRGARKEVAAGPKTGAHTACSSVIRRAAGPPGNAARRDRNPCLCAHRDCANRNTALLFSSLTLVYICAYLKSVDCEWDTAKAEANFVKHGVRFADAVSALEDDLALTIRDPHSEDEERWITLGADALGRVLVVVYTWRGEKLRIISARPATPQEKRQYGKSNEA